MRTDELISQATAKSTRFLSIVAGTILVTKFAGQWPTLVQLPGDVRLAGTAMDWIAFAVLAYLAAHHMTYWMIDSAAFHSLVREDHFFGDHPESWDGPRIPLRGHLTNARIAIQDGFGYSVFTWPILLVYVLNLLLPSALWIGAAVALVIA